MRKCIYIAGAISSNNLLKSFENIRKGIKLSVDVLKAGHAPFSPFIDFQYSLVTKITIEEYYAYSLAWLEKADGLILVEGYENSKGTLAEIKRAKQLGIPVYFSMEELVDAS